MEQKLFDKLADAGRCLVRNTSFALGLSSEALAARCRVGSETVNVFVSPTAPTPILTGRDWERLMGACGVLAEDWIQAAKLTHRMVTGSMGANKPLASGALPSEEANRKIQRILQITGDFYNEASVKWAVAQKNKE